MVERPDYPQAVRHLTQMRNRQLEIAGIRDAAERAQIIQQEGLGVAARAFQDGGNPAERIYQISQAMGYAPPAPQPLPEEAPAHPNGVGNGSEPSLPVQPTAQQRLETIQRGQQQARSL